MERLTRKDAYGFVQHPWEFNGVNGSYDIWDEELLAKQIDRLAAYEDTGLEPEEIKVHEAAKYNAGYYHGDEDRCRWIEKELGPIDHLRDLLQAEKEGRMVLLPCKVGDRVWVTRAYGKPFDAPREGHVRKFVVHDDELVFLEALIWMDLGEGKNEYGYRTESFGKIVHLTRKEAEAVLALALKGGDG